MQFHIRNRVPVTNNTAVQKVLQWPLGWKLGEIDKVPEQNTHRERHKGRVPGAYGLLVGTR